ncbi:MAG: hypothetical protein IJU75_02170 [Clostridia bacterium]|nr:hypothetical protein [Clostridia bacterium]
MKKFAALLIALVMVLAVFASCQTNDVKPGGDTTVPKQTDDKTTTEAPATEPAPATSEIVTDEATEPVEDGLPKVRTIYSADNRSKLQLLDHGVDGQVVNSFVQGKNFVVDGKIDSDGKVEAAIAEWDVIETNGAQYTNDGSHTYFPFIGFKKDVTINEVIIGDVSAWRGDYNIETDLYTDYADLEIWYTDNPNGTWTKWECTASSFENPDNGILYGSYPQGISFKGEDITGRYFMVYDPDPQVIELWIACNLASPAVIYNPPAAD